MIVKPTIDLTKKLPKSAVQVLEKQLLNAFQNQFDECSLVIPHTGCEGVTVYGGEKKLKIMIDEILQQTWESADDWFI